MRVLIILAALVAAGCTTREPSTADASGRGRVQVPNQAAVAALDQALAEHRIVTAGVGVLRNGELVWSLYYGEQSPGVVAAASTRFNVASITKMVVAEAALRLATQGELDLDAPLARHWVDPDLAGDPRRDELTARMVLNHTTGFPNWRFFRADGKLVFEHDPGTRYGYSGEGFEYVARAIAAKMGRPFPTVMQETLLEDAGMADTVIGVHREGLANVARPVDEHGVFPGWYCRPEGWCRADGDYSAADDLLMTVPDAARFLAVVLRAEGYGATLAQERDRVQTDRDDERLVECTADPAADCPIAQGYGLGVEVARFKDHWVIGHGGSDWAEQSLAYLYQPSGDGVIIFLNAPNRQAMAAMPELLDVLDPGSPFTARYRQWLAR
jgi:CubicO group peptidase (beta-lactamase class C family)